MIPLLHPGHIWALYRQRAYNKALYTFIRLLYFIFPYIHTYTVWWVIWYSYYVITRWRRYTVLDNYRYTDAVRLFHIGGPTAVYVTIWLHIAPPPHCFTCLKPSSATALIGRINYLKRQKNNNCRPSGCNESWKFVHISSCICMRNPFIRSFIMLLFYQLKKAASNTTYVNVR